MSRLRYQLSCIGDVTMQALGLVLIAIGACGYLVLTLVPLALAVVVVVWVLRSMGVL